MIDGLVLSGGLPTFVAPEYDSELGMAHGVTPDSLKAALAATPGARAAFIVSPTYYGMAADVAVFDLARVGTSVAPQQLIARPRGVEHVLVNGTPVIRHGEPTDARPGAIGAGR